MSDYAMFFDSQKNDRVYDTESFLTWCRRFFRNGIVRSPGGEYGLRVSSAGGRQVSISPGSVFVNGAVKAVRELITLSVPACDGVCNVVMEYNQARDMRDITVKIVEPQPDGTAAAPTRSDATFQLVIARIDSSQQAGRDNITPDDILDTRADDDVCGFMTCTVDESTTQDIISSIMPYLNGIFETSAEKYQTLRASLAAKLDPATLDTVDALINSILRGEHLISDAEALQDSIDSTEEYVDTKIAAAKVLYANPSVTNLGTALSGMSFSESEMSRLKAVVLTYAPTSITTRRVAVTLMPTKIADGTWTLFSNIEGWVWEENTMSKSGTTYTNTNHKFIDTCNITITLGITNGVYKPTAVSTKNIWINSDTKWTFTHASGSTWPSTATRTTPVSTNNANTYTSFSVYGLQITAIY